MSFIYVASPYTSPDESIMHERYLAAMRYTSNALRNGHFVFSPIVHCHEMARQYTLPRDHEFWLAYDKIMIDASSGIEVLAIPGWLVSAGVQWEIEYAQSMSIPITTIAAEHPWLQESSPISA